MRIHLISSVLALTVLASAGGMSSADEKSLAAEKQSAKLIAVLKSDAPYQEKANACRELALVGGHDAIAVLAGLLGDEKLSHMARYGLEPIPDPAVDEAFRAALGRLQGRQLVGVIGSIGVRRDGKAVEPLAQRLKDKDAEVVQTAARALGKIATPDALKALETALVQVPAESQLSLCEGMFRCAEALKAQGKREEARAVYDLLRKQKAPGQVRAAAVRGAILTRGKEGVPLLREYLGSKDLALFTATVRTAQEMPMSEVVEALAVTFKEGPADRQYQVGTALVYVADKLLQGKGDMKTAASLTEPLQRVAQSSVGPEVTEPAKVLLQRAQKISEQK